MIKIKVKLQTVGEITKNRRIYNMFKLNEYKYVVEKAKDDKKMEGYGFK